MNIQQFQKLKQILAVPSRMVLLGHKSPDGDAVGACLAMQYYLKRKGHIVQSIVPDAIPDVLSWMPDFASIFVYEKQENICNKKIKEADFIFLLDFNAFERLGKDLEKILLEKPKNNFAIIDHHKDPQKFSDYLFHNSKNSSTCELIYNFILKMQEEHLINKEIATCLYTGIITDTNAFKTPLTSSHTHRIVADLIEKGAVNYKISEYIYQQNTFEKLQILAIALKNLKILKDFFTAYITLSINDLAPIKRKKGDTENLVNYALSLKNVYFAAIFVEDEKKKMIKISFRSKGDFSVNHFAKKHFNGGGHKNAAGGISEQSLQKTLREFEKLLPFYKKYLKKINEN